MTHKTIGPYRDYPQQKANELDLQGAKSIVIKGATLKGMGKVWFVEYVSRD